MQVANQQLAVRSVSEQSGRPFCHGCQYYYSWYDYPNGFFQKSISMEQSLRSTSIRLEGYGLVLIVCELRVCGFRLIANLVMVAVFVAVQANFIARAQ